MRTFINFIKRITRALEHRRYIRNKKYLQALRERDEQQEKKYEL